MRFLLHLTSSVSANCSTRSWHRAGVEDEIFDALEERRLDILVHGQLAALTMPMSMPARMAW